MRSLVNVGLDTQKAVAHVIDRLRALLGGAPPDFTFAWEGGQGWDQLLVVRFAAREAISSLFRYEVTLLLRGHAMLYPDELIGERACLRIATLVSPGYRIVHGVITDAEELAPVPEGRLYRVILEPPLALAQYRVRSRIFLDKTLRQIIDAVLSPLFTRNDKAHADGDDEHPQGYTPPVTRFCYRITDTARLDDPAARPYTVQYDESDFAFLSRLLEDEGISYHFENSAGSCVLVLADADVGRPRIPRTLQYRDVQTLRLGGRLRAKKVKLGDYEWRKPALPMRAEAGGRAAELCEHRYPGAFQDRPELGKPLAQARLERLGVEASYATGTGAARDLAAGTIFRLDHDGAHHDGQYLVTQLDLWGEQAGVISRPTSETPEPFSASFELARSRFRPARVTPRPRIVGSQTAFVTGERGAEIDVNDTGCVRLRFHWDEEPGEPSSCWVRVSQMFAGAGRGAVFHPRIGDEVIVEFLEGDPDRPIVTGRVYNGANRPPGEGNNVSTIKSTSTPGGGVINALAFDDTAGRERIALQAGRDYSTHVGNDRAESVTNNASSRVGVDRSEHTGANRSTAVGGNNGEHVAGHEAVGVGGNQTTTIGANQSLAIGADRSVSIAANQTTTIGAAHALSVSAAQSIRVGADRSIDVGGSLSEAVAGSASHAVAGNRAVSIAGNQDTSIGANRGVTVGGSQVATIGAELALNVGASAAASVGGDASLSAGASVSLTAGGTVTVNAHGEAVIQAPSVTIVAAEIVFTTGAASLRLNGATLEICAATLKATGGATDIVGGMLKLN
ncbi:type VI secretion system Vgr family protein [Polyangium aurulentum]|uniref:type VI secretion system Vgr family protein n=1 Tax=Polyangium aurulentum TaxID=2567896 RepID=UPI0010AECA9A|nr:type VI secretion system tip protein TssI/VgrG [Polyangium aurulentum]UQA59974.1 type VI secretion system tip protein VgrG [Polyangium aurulentum]